MVRSKAKKALSVKKSGFSFLRPKQILLFSTSGRSRLLKMSYIKAEIYHEKGLEISGKKHYNNMEPDL